MGSLFSFPRAAPLASSAAGIHVSCESLESSLALPWLRVVLKHVSRRCSFGVASIFGSLMVRPKARGRLPANICPSSFHNSRCLGGRNRVFEANEVNFQCRHVRAVGVLPTASSRICDCLRRFACASQRAYSPAGSEEENNASLYAVRKF